MAVVLDDVISGDCFSFTEIFGIVNSVGLGGEALEDGALDLASPALFLSP